MLRKKSVNQSPAEKEAPRSSMEYTSSGTPQNLVQVESGTRKRYLKKMKISVGPLFNRGISTLSAEFMEIGSTSKDAEATETDHSPLNEQQQYKPGQNPEPSPPARLSTVSESGVQDFGPTSEEIQTLQRQLREANEQIAALQRQNETIRKEQSNIEQNATQLQEQQKRELHTVEASLKSTRRLLASARKERLEADDRHQEMLSVVNAELLDSNQLNTELKAANQTLRREKEGLERRVTEHQQRIQGLAQERTTLEATIARNKLTSEKDRMTINGLQIECGNLKKQIRITEQSSEQLQAQLFHIERGVNPLRDETYYTQKFAEIEVDFDMWVARHCSLSSEVLSKAGEQFLLQSLSTLGPHGKSASEYLRVNQRIGSWYKDAGTRIPLIRHIAAVFLFELVLGPFVFGLSPELSQAFSWVDADIMSHG